MLFLYFSLMLSTFEIFRLSKKITNNIVYFLPRNADIDQVSHYWKASMSLWHNCYKEGANKDKRHFCNWKRAYEQSLAFWLLLENWKCSVVNSMPVSPSLSPQLLVYLHMNRALWVFNCVSGKEGKDDGVLCFKCA